MTAHRRSRAWAGTIVWPRSLKSRIGTDRRRPVACHASIVASSRCSPTRAPCAAIPAAGAVATGDWVLVDDARTKAGGRRDRCRAPRRSSRGDPMEGEALDEQVIAANIDTVFVVHSLTNGPNLRRLERELVLVYESGAMPVVVLTKARPRPGDGRRENDAVRSVAPAARRRRHQRGDGPRDRRAAAYYAGDGRTVALDRRVGGRASRRSSTGSWAPRCRTPATCAAATSAAGTRRRRVSSSRSRTAVCSSTRRAARGLVVGRG